MDRYGLLNQFSHIVLKKAKELRFADSDSSNYIAFKSPATVASDITFTLPGVDGSANQALYTDGAGTLGWKSFLAEALSDGAIYIGNGSNVGAAYDTDLVGDLRAYVRSFEFVDGDIIVGDDSITETAHGLEDDQIVYLTNSGGALPAGLSASTPYYVIVVDANTIKLSASAGGAPVDITAAAGGGTHTLHYGGLQLKAGVIANANIVSDAAIALSKLAALTASRALVSDGSGVISVSAVTSTELGYVSGVTSAIQTQLDGKASTALDNLASVAINTALLPGSNDAIDLGSAALGWQDGYINKLHLDSNSQTTVIQGSASASASVTYSLPPADGSAGHVLSTNGSGVLTWVSNASVSSYKTDWALADGASKVVTHSLGSKDVIVQLYDKANDATIDVESVVRTDVNTVTLIASEAPNASGWRVIVLLA